MTTEAPGTKPPLPLVFSTSEARAHGIPATRLRGPLFQSIRRGLYAHRDRDYGPVDVARAICRSDTEAVVVGQSAAAFWDLPMPTRPKPFPLHVATHPGRRPRPDQIVHWRRQAFAPVDVVETSGLRVTTRVRTWADLGELLTEEALVVIADHLLRTPRQDLDGRVRPFATLAHLQRAADQSLRAATRLKAALSVARVGADSPAETRLRLACLRAGFPEPQLNPVLPIPDGGRHQPDLLWKRYGVCAEYDGSHHRTPEQHNRDIRRRERAESIGLKEIAVSAIDMRDGASAAVSRIQKALLERGWRPDPGCVRDR